LVCSLIKQISDDAAADPAALVVDLVSADARLIPRGQTLAQPSIGGLGAGRRHGRAARGIRRNPRGCSGRAALR